MSEKAANTPNAAGTASERTRLEEQWRARFEKQPKLPTSALLTGAVSMALGFGAMMFLFFWYASKTGAWSYHALVFGGLAVALSLVNRYLAQRWYRHVVVPWSKEREELKARLARMREEES